MKHFKYLIPRHLTKETHSNPYLMFHVLTSNHLALWEYCENVNEMKFILSSFSLANELLPST